MSVDMLQNIEVNKMCLTHKDSNHYPLKYMYVRIGIKGAETELYIGEAVWPL